MSDSVYPGVVLVRVPRAVQEQHLKNYVKKLIGEGSENYRYGEPEVEIYQKENSHNLIVVSGILRTFAEIKNLFSRQLGGVEGLPHPISLFVKGVDFGVPRERDEGRQKYHLLKLHNTLKTSHGDYPIINILRSSFLDDLGPLEDLEPTVFFDAPKEMIKEPIARKLRVAGRFSVYSKTFRRGSKFRPHLPQDCTEIFFQTRIEAIQCICLYNLNLNFCSEKRAFLTWKDGTECKLSSNFGLGINGQPINVAELMEKYKYIPFDEIPSLPISDIKLGKLRNKKCFICGRVYIIKGVSPNFNWLAGVCSCKLEKSEQAWKNEDFYRISLSTMDLALFNKFADEEACNVEPLKLTRGMPPLYENVQDFRSSAWQAYLSESRYSKRDLHNQQTLGTVTLVKFLEKRNVRKKPRQAHVVKLRVRETKLWNPAGRIKMHEATLIPLIDAIPIMEKDTKLVSYPKANSDKHIRSVVHDISTTTENHVEVTLVAYLTSMKPVHVGDKLIIVPKPPTCQREAIRSALTSWKLIENPATTLQVYKFSISSSKQFGVWDRNLETVWEVIVLLQECKQLLSLAGKLEEIIVGAKILLESKQTGNADSLVTTTSVARITEIQSLQEDDAVVVAKMVITLPQALQVNKFKGGSLTLWMIGEDNEREPVHNSNAMPAGMEEDEDSDYYAEEEEDDDEEKASRKCSASNYIPHPMKVKNLWIDVHYQQIWKPQQLNIDSVLKYWRQPYQPEYKNLKFLKFPSSLRAGDLNSLLVEERHFNDKMLEIMCGLNMSQTRAVETMVTGNLSVVQGPPGTGKSHVAAKGIAVLCAKNNGFVACCCPSVHACLVIYEKIKTVNEAHQLGLNIIHMIANGREYEDLKARSDRLEDADPNLLHVRVRLHPLWKSKDPKLTKIIKKVETEGTAHLVGDETELYERHKNYICRLILSDADIVVCTVACCSDGRLEGGIRRMIKRGRKFSALVVDEGSLLTIPTVLPLLLLETERICIYGDDCQLPPTVMDASAEIAGLGISFMENLRLTPYIKKTDALEMLDIQYRMATSIASIVSSFMYDGKVKSSRSVRERKYEDHAILDALPEFETCNETESRGKTACNVACYTYMEPCEKKGENSCSTYNLAEVEITRDLLKRMKGHVQMSKVFIISMYDRQTELLREMISKLGSNYQGVQVSNTDGFQGKEESVIILNTVRSNKQFDVGFLRDKRRMNVAISRPLDYLIVVCHVPTLSGCKLPDFKTWFGLLEREKVQFKLYEKKEDEFVQSEMKPQGLVDFLKSIKN